MGEAVADVARLSNAAAGSADPALTGVSTHPGLLHAGEFRKSAPMLRVISLVFAMVALMLLALDELEKESIEASVPGLSKPLYLPRSASFVDTEVLRFYLGSLAVLVIGYSFLQAILSVINLLSTKSWMRSKAISWITFIADQAIAFLLVSAAAVATEIGYLSKHGAPKVGWNEVCTQFNRFCRVYAISLINAYLAVLAIFVSPVISAYHLFQLYAQVMPVDRETQNEFNII